MDNLLFENGQKKIFIFLCGGEREQEGRCSGDLAFRKTKQNKTGKSNLDALPRIVACG